MMQSLMRLLSNSEIAELRERVAMFLSERGVELQHAGMLEKLLDLGVRVDRSSGLVRFPLKLQEQALQSLPRTFTLTSPGPREATGPGCSTTALPLPHPAPLPGGLPAQAVPAPIQGRLEHDRGEDPDRSGRG